MDKLGKQFQQEMEKSGISFEVTQRGASAGNPQPAPPETAQQFADAMGAQLGRTPGRSNDR
jgi:hypothetical protein